MAIKLLRQYAFQFEHEIVYKGRQLDGARQIYIEYCVKNMFVHTIVYM